MIYFNEVICVIAFQQIGLVDTTTMDTVFVYYLKIALCYIRNKARYMIPERIIHKLVHQLENRIFYLNILFLRMMDIFHYLQDTLYVHNLCKDYDKQYVILLQNRSFLRSCAYPPVVFSIIHTKEAFRKLLL